MAFSSTLCFPVLFCVALWFIPRELNVLKSRALCPRFSVCFSILVTSLGEEGAGLCASRTFVCLFCACMFLSFFSSSWPRFVIVASSGPFYKLFFQL